MANGPETIALVHSFAALLACVFIFLFVALASPNRRKPLRISVILYAIAANLWAMQHSADRDPWQWPAMFIGVSAFLLVPTYFVAVRFVDLEAKARKKLLRADSQRKLRRSDQTQA